MRFLLPVLLVCGFATLATAHAQQPPGPYPPPAPVAADSTDLALTLPAPAEAVETATGSVTFLGNSTVLIRYAGLTVMTDPDFLRKGERAQLGYGLRATRLTDPALDFDRLPPIDLIVLTDMHDDHFDPLLRQKLRRDMPIVTTPDASDALEKIGFTMRYPLNAWDALMVKKGIVSLKISAMPGRHGPPVIAGLMPRVMGVMLDFSADGKSYRIYVSGDTVVTRAIEEIPRRYRNVDLALLHLGGARLFGVFTVTMNATQGARMIQIIDPAHAIPIHYDDYDVFKSPIEEFKKALTEAELQDKAVYLKRGEAYSFSPHLPN